MLKTLSLPARQAPEVIGKCLRCGVGERVLVHDQVVDGEEVLPRGPLFINQVPSLLLHNLLKVHPALLQSRIDCETLPMTVCPVSVQISLVQRKLLARTSGLFNFMGGQFSKRCNVALTAQFSYYAFFEMAFALLKANILIIFLLLFFITGFLRWRQGPILVLCWVVLGLLLAIVLNLVGLCDDVRHEKPTHDVLRQEHCRVKDEFFQPAKVPQVVQNVVLLPLVYVVIL